MLSKQTAISAAASVFAMACFALLSPQSQPLETLAQGTVSTPVMQAEAPSFDPQLPTLGF